MSTKEKKMKICMSDLEIGEILEFERRLGPFIYHHCGIYAGNNTVAHKGLDPKLGGIEAIIEVLNNPIRSRNDYVHDVAAGSKVYRNNMFDDTTRPSKKKLLFRIGSSIGEAGYHLWYNNCQHYCMNVRYGIAFSREVDMIQTGWFLTSARPAFTKDMVEVSLDDDKCKHKDRFDLSDIRKPSENKNHSIICKPTNAFTSIFERQPHDMEHHPVCLPETYFDTHWYQKFFGLFTTCLPYNELQTNNTLLRHDSFNKSLIFEKTSLLKIVCDALPLDFSPLPTDTLFETHITSSKTRSSVNQTLHEIPNHVFTYTLTETQISTLFASIPRTITSVPYDAIPSSKIFYLLDQTVPRSYNQSGFENLSDTVFSNKSNNACKYTIISLDIQSCQTNSTSNGSLKITANIPPKQTSSTSKGSLLKCLIFIFVCIGLPILFGGIRYLLCRRHTVPKLTPDGHTNMEFVISCEDSPEIGRQSLNSRNKYDSYRRSRDRIRATHDSYRRSRDGIRNTHEVISKMQFCTK